MGAAQCPIWRTVVDEPSPIAGDYTIVHSARAGGRYRISGSAAAEIEQARLSDRERAKLTTWIIEQGLLGDLPEVTTTTLRVVKQRRNLQVYERADRLLRYFARSSDYIGTEIRFDLGIGADLGSNDAMLLAASESLNADEVKFLIRCLEERRWVRGTWTSTEHERGIVGVTPEGYARLAELEQQTVVTSQAFVAMWFSHETNGAYSEGIEPAIRDAGYRSLRIDRKEHINKIDDEIIAEIRRSRFVVADFTAEVVKWDSGGSLSSREPREVYVARGGVYYEAGFAQGLNIPVIWTCRQDVINHVHFDTRQFNHITWVDPQDLYAKLKNRIGAMIGDGPLKGQGRDRP